MLCIVLIVFIIPNNNRLFASHHRWIYIKRENQGPQKTRGTKKVTSVHRLPSADQKAARAIAVHHPSCIVHMRIYHRLGNSPLVFQFLHLPPFLPLAHPPDPSAPLSKNEQEKLGAYAPTEHQSNSTCRCSQ